MKPGKDYVGVSTLFFCTDGNGNFVMAKRGPNSRDEQGRWETGGGQLEFNSTLEENVLRELREEYGCSGEILEQLPPFEVFREQSGSKTHWVGIPYIIKVDPAEVINNEPESIDEIGWFTFDNLPRPLHSQFERAMVQYKDYFEKYQK